MKTFHDEAREILAKYDETTARETLEQCRAALAVTKLSFLTVRLEAFRDAALERLHEIREAAE